MFFASQTRGTAACRAGRRSSRIAPVAALALALAALAMVPSAGVASNTITAGLGGTTIEVNGTTISTSNLTLGELGRLQGVPPTTVNLELDGLAAGLPQAAAVDSLVGSLPVGTSLSSALDQLSGASGGAISPPTALLHLIEDNGQPGASGSASASSTGGPGAQGAGGSPGGAGAAGANAGAATRKAFTLHLSSRSLKGHPRKRVSVRFTVSSAATIRFSGRGLAGGSRKVRQGANVLVVKLPGRHGNYSLALKATAEGHTAQATVALHDALVRISKKARG